MTRRIATAAATMAALLLLPASALAADSASVNAGVLTYTSGAGTKDVIWVTDGNGPRHLVSDWSTPSGVPGANCTASGISFECTGATSVSLSTLDGDDTVVVFSALPATISGGDGNDRLTGGPVADTIDAGDGADAVDARDGVVDTVDCGPGIDVAQADAGDVVTNCNDVPPPGEAPVLPSGEPVVPPADVPVDVPPLPVVAAPVAPPDLAVAPVMVARQEVKVGANGVATFELACAPTEPAGCAGMLYLDPAPRRAKRGPRALAARRGRYGRSRFEVASGGTTRLRMSLSASARRALGLPRGRRAQAARRGRRVPAVVTVAQPGKKPVRSKVTLKR